MSHNDENEPVDPDEETYDDCDADGDDVDMPNLRAMLRHFEKEDCPEVPQEYSEFAGLLHDSKKALYPKCKKHHSKLASRTIEI